MSKIRLIVKPTTGTVKYTVGAEASWTVAQLKEDVARQAEGSASDLRLIYKGKILKDAETVESLGLENDHVIHMVKTKAANTAGTSASTPASAQPVAPPAAVPSPLGDIAGMGPGALGAGFGGMPSFGGNMMPNPEQLAAMMNNPMMQSLLDNPEIMRTMINSNPTVRQLMDTNPEVAHILNNPQLLRESLQVATTPGLQLEQMRNQDRAMSNIEAHPEGFNALRRMYETIQEPLMNATTSEAAATSNPFAALFQGAGGATAPAGSAGAAAPAAPGGAPNNQPLPNPWAPAAAPAAGNAAGGLGAGMPGVNPMAGFGGLPGMGAGGLGGASPFGAMDPSQMMSLMQTPAMQNFVSSVLSQPGYMEAALSANPQMQQMMEQEPGMRELLRNPEVMRRMLDPSNIQAMAQMRQAMDQLSAAGLGPNLGGLGGAGLGGGLGDLSGLLGGLPTGVPPVANPTEFYANELQQLVEMGFIDQQANINALQATGGNVSAAVARLCEQGNLPT